MLISRRVVGYIVAALPRVARGGGAAYASVANGRRTSRNGVLTEGVHLIGDVVDGFLVGHRPANPFVWWSVAIAP